MIKGLENLHSKKKLKQSGLFSLEKRRLVGHHHSIPVTAAPGEASFLSKKFFTMITIIHWNNFPGVGTPNTGDFQDAIGQVLDNLIKAPFHHDVGSGSILRSLPMWDVLRFCYCLKACFLLNKSKLFSLRYGSVLKC